MRAGLQISSLLTLVFLVGCDELHTLKPILREDDLVDADFLVGKYEGFSIRRLSKGNYSMEGYDDVKKVDVKFPVQVGQIGTHYFLSFQAPDGPYFSTYKIMVLGDEVHMLSLNRLWKDNHKKNTTQIELKELKDKLGKPIRDEFGIRTKEVLTYDTDTLRGLIEKDFDNQEFLSLGTDYSRKDSKGFRRTGGFPITKDGLASKRHRTYSYWFELRRLMLQPLPAYVNPKNTKEVVEHIRTRSRAVTGIPTLGVDADALACALAAAEAMDSLADFLGRDQVAAGIEAFVRGFYGDPFGVANEQLKASNTVTQNLRDLDKTLRRARASLTEKHELEFPKIGK